MELLLFSLVLTPFAYCMSCISTSTTVTVSEKNPQCKPLILFCAFLYHILVISCLYLGFCGHPLTTVSQQVSIIIPSVCPVCSIVVSSFSIVSMN